jgi:hypothetical protein
MVEKDLIQTEGQLSCSDCDSKKLQVIYIKRLGNDFLLSTCCLNCGALTIWNLRKDFVSSNITKDKEVKL